MVKALMGNQKVIGGVLIVGGVVLLYCGYKKIK